MRHVPTGYRVHATVHVGTTTLVHQLLAGRLPFTSSDPLEVVHSHLARRARPVHEVVPGTPRAVSDIVEKLMAKTPEDRYQTASGCQRDLQECLRRLDAGEVAPFALGSTRVRIGWRTCAWLPSRLHT